MKKLFNKIKQLFISFDRIWFPEDKRTASTLGPITFEIKHDIEADKET